MNDLFKSLSHQNQNLQNKASELLTFAKRPTQDNREKEQEKEQLLLVQNASSNQFSKDADNLRLFKQTDVQSSSALQNGLLLQLPGGAPYKADDISNILINSR